MAPQPFFQERGTPIAVKLALEALGRKLQRSSNQTDDPIDLLTYAEGEEVAISGVCIIRIPSPSILCNLRPGISVKKLVCDIIFAWKAFALLWRARHNQYAVIHAVEESVFIAWLAKQLFGVPYVYDMDSSLALQVVEKWRLCAPLLPILQWFERVAVRGSLAVAPVCDALEAIANKHGAAHTVMLRDVSLLPDQELSPSDTHQPFGPDVPLGRPILLYVGNLETYQGIDLLLESFARVAHHNTLPCLVIIGGNEGSIAQYRRKVAQLGGCNESVFFLGPKPVRDLKHYLMHADILLSPRIKGNNTPMKIYSYLHAGRALVATDLETHRQVLDEEIAVLCAPTAAQFAQGLELVLSDSALREAIGNRARSRAENLYTPAAFETQLSALYDAVAARVSKAEEPILQR
jgi:glycosyltransferase involved in cell wall biosynthesis